MALEDTVNQWFTANPNATPQQVADAVKSVGGLEANSGLSNILADRYGTDVGTITSGYNQLTAPTGGDFAQAATSNDVGQVTSAPVGGLQQAAAAQPVAQAAPISITSPSPIQTSVDKWYTDNPNATPQQLAAAVQSAGGLTPELANVLASKYGTTANEITAGYNNLVAPTTTPTSYISQLEAASPGVTDALKPYTQYYANERFGGNIQDWQAQIFTPLDTSKTSAPKQLDFTPIKTEMLGSGDGEYQSTTGGELKTEGVQPIRAYGGDSEGPIIGYESTTPTTVNGLSVYAHYDPTGKLEYYAAPEATFIDGKTTARGMWNADGTPRVNVQASGGGGFIKGLGNDVAGFTQSLGPIWTAAKIAFPQLNLVDVGADVARSEVDLNTAVKGALGYAGVQNSSAADLTNPSSVNATSGLDVGSGVSPAVQMTQNAQYAKLGAAGVSAGMAADQGNYAPLLALAANVSGANKMPEVAIASNTLAAANAISTNNPAALMSAAGNLTNSPDLKLAGAATNLLQAQQSGNESAIAVAAMGFASAVKANTPSASSTLKNTIFGPSKIDASSLPQGSPINPSGPSTNTPDAGVTGGLQLAGVNGGTTSDAGNDAFRVESSGVPIFAGTENASKVSAPFGYRLMTMDEADARPQGSYYDITQNAWFAPDEGGMDEIRNLRDSLTGEVPEGYGTDVTNLDRTGGQNGVSGTSPYTSSTGPLSNDLGEVVIKADRPVTNDLGEVVIKADRLPNDVADLGEVVITDNRDPTVVTPPVVVPPKVTPTSTPINPTPTKTTIASPLSYANQAMPKLDSSPQGLTSTMQKNKKILKELTMLFGTLTPELVSALEDRGIRVPPTPDSEEEKEEEERQEEPDLEKQLAEDRALETKFAATGGEITSKIDPKITYANAGLLPAAQVIEHQSRLGGLKHLHEGLVPRRATVGMAKGGLPSKYAEAVPEGHKPEFITGLTGYYASGAGTGQSDDIDAMLHDGDYVADADLVAALGDGSSKAGAEALEKFRRSVPHQENAQGGSVVPAKIADGEYVFPASFVTAIGKGDNKAGAALLDKMREAIRAHKRSAPTSKIPPKAKSPLDYLKMVKG
jgi:hypothetical protein